MIDLGDEQTKEVLSVLNQGIVNLYREIRHLELSYARYEYLRRLNPRQFTELWKANLNGEGAFDDLVDRRITEEKRK